MRFLNKTIAGIVACTSIISLSGMYSTTAMAVLDDCVEYTLTEETTNFYDQWKSKYLIKNNYVTDEDQYYVLYSEGTYADNQYTTEVTVSEAHGYGMLIAASMAEYDNGAKEIFDGMYNFYKAHPSSIGPNLMAWQQSDTGSAIVDTSADSDSATDGDMDIAYALLMADSVWGSGGEINYRQAAIDVINDIMTYEVNKTDWILQLGDWVYWSKPGDQYYSATRASDFIVQYMPIFAEVTGDERWMNVYESTYNIINSITSEYDTGILPDFIVKDEATGKFIPAPENYLESEYDGYYYYNSCRTPWRISMDYLFNGNADALMFAIKLNSFITKATNSDPWEIMAGYKLDGTPLEDYNDLCFTAPFLISAACGDDKEWHSEVRDVVVNYGDDVYFGDTIKMLCLIVDDGCWIVPKSDIKPVLGDVNADGKFSIADLIMLQKWLVNAGEINDWEAGDLNQDVKINIADLCLMKQMLMEQTEK